MLVIGGVMRDPDGRSITSAEILDPTTGHWMGTVSMVAPMREGQGLRAFGLRDGRVVVDGGCCPAGPTSPEVFDPATRQFATFSRPTGRMIGVMADGRVLHLAATESQSGAVYTSLVPLLTDPSTGATTDVIVDPSVAIERDEPEAIVPLPNGLILLVTNAAGSRPGYGRVASLLNPASGDVWVIGDWTFDHPLPVAVLADGRVLLAGSVLTGDETKRFAEVFDPTENTFVKGGTPPAGTLSALGTLPDGRLLLRSDAVRGPVLFDPFDGSFTPIVGGAASRPGAALAVLSMDASLSPEGTLRGAGRGVSPTRRSSTRGLVDDRLGHPQRHRLNRPSGGGDPSRPPAS